MSDGVRNGRDFYLPLVYALPGKQSGNEILPFVHSRAKAYSFWLIAGDS
jgi:hypothetical protein